MSFHGLELESTLIGHRDPVYCLLSYGNSLASGSEDRYIKLWNDKDECISTLDAHCSIYSLAIFNGKIISGDSSGIIRCWNSSEGSVIRKTYQPCPIYSLVISNGLLYHGDHKFNVSTFLGGGDDGKDMNTRTLFTNYTNYVSCLIEGNGMMISGSLDGTIRCWSTVSPYNTNPNSGITVPSHDYFSISEDHLCKEGGIRCLAIYDNYLLSSGSCDATMKLWEMGGCRETFKQEGSVRGILVVGWEMRCCRQTFKHEGSVMSILVVGKFIISGDSSGKIYTWLSGGNLLESIQAHTGSVNTLVMHQNHIYSGSDDTTIRKWSLPRISEDVPV